MKYKVIKPYQSRAYSPPITLPVGTVLDLWEERGYYLSEAVNNMCVPVARWAVEAWYDYFEKIDPAPCESADIQKGYFVTPKG